MKYTKSKLGAFLDISGVGPLKVKKKEKKKKKKKKAKSREKKYCNKKIH